MAISERLKQLDITLPDPPKAVASYVPGVISGNLCYTSGQLPLLNGRLVAEGRVGDDVTIDQAYQAARQSALNALSVAADTVGAVDKIVRVVKVVGFVQSGESFHEQPLVINGASEVLQQIFGESGRHARSAIGTNTLPLNAAVEVEVIFEVQH